MISYYDAQVNTQDDKKVLKENVIEISQYNNLKSAINLHKNVS